MLCPLPRLSQEAGWMAKESEHCEVKTGNIRVELLPTCVECQ